MEYNVGAALLLTAGAGLCTTIGSVLGLAVKKPGPTFMGFTLGVSAGVRETLLSALGNDTDRAVWGRLTGLFARHAWWPILMAAPLAAGAVGSVVFMLRRDAAKAVALTAVTTLLAWILFVLTIVPVLNGVRGLGEFAESVRGHLDGAGPGARVLVATAECHELALALGDRAVDLDAVSDFPVGVARDVEAGRPWLVVSDRDAYEAGRWNHPGLAWRVVGETVAGHRRPMVLLEPELKIEDPP